MSASRCRENESTSRHFVIRISVVFRLRRSDRHCEALRAAYECEREGSYEKRSRQRYHVGRARDKGDAIAHLGTKLV